MSHTKKTSGTQSSHPAAPNRHPAAQPNTLYQQAFSLHQQGKFEDAKAIYEQVLALDPKNFHALHLSGVLAGQNKQLEAAIHYIDQALALNPQHAEAYYNRGVALQELKRFEEAVASLDQAVKIKPDYIDAYCSRATALEKMERFDEAVLSYDEAIRIKPDYADAYWNKSLALLLQGDFAQGWELYEWRWLCKDLELFKRDFSQPLWLGVESLEGKTILLHSEQGLGDTLQFCRYAKSVKARGARVLLEVPAPLVLLLKPLEGVDVVIERGAALPEFDYHCPLLSLPLAFKTRLETIPSADAYLKADAERIATWSARLGEKTLPRIGLVWSGNTGHKNDSNRSIALQNLLEHLPRGFEYVSLQKELRASDQAAYEHSGIRFFGEQLTDFADTAALCTLMDVVVSVDTSVAHLSAALGCKTWIVLPYIPDWRWLLDRTDSPWYRSATLYRQGEDRSWEPVLHRVAAYLRGLGTRELSMQEGAQIDVLCRQGFALHQQGQLEQAKAIYEQVLASNPRHFDALHLLGVMAVQTQQFEMAVRLIDQALAVNSEHADALYNRGIALQGCKRLEEAVASFDQAIRVKPDYADAYYNRGLALDDLKQLEEAVASYDNAIRIKSDYAAAYVNRGLTLMKLKRLSEALTSFDNAIRIKPDYEKAYFNRGSALQELRNFAQAVVSYDNAIHIKPDYADAHWNKSLALLLQGHFEPGWELYEWRWSCESLGLAKRNFSQALWLGKESLKGKTVLLHSEQGLGDTLQFCRYAAWVKERGARVLLQVQKPLLTLLQNLKGVDAVFEPGKALPEFDYHCALMSLPLAFQTRLNTIPHPHAYLTADAERVALWSARLGTRIRPRIGLVWSGSTSHKDDHNRSIALQSLLAHLPAGLEYVSLQKELRESDQAAYETSGIRFFGEQLTDFADTAALCKLMDVVVSVDTSVAHLSAALGCKTWIVLPYIPDWRWLLDRPDSPWYRSVTLYRQGEDRSWGPVLDRVAADLHLRAAHHQSL